MTDAQQAGQLAAEAAGAAAFRGAYRSKLSRSRSGGLLESVGALERASPTLVEERVGALRAELLRVVETFLDNDAEARDVAEQLARDGAASLRMLLDDDPKLAPRTKYAGDLEAIIRADGSRPSFLIANKPSLGARARRGRSNLR
jgi:hypothetical protein